MSHTPFLCSKVVRLAIAQVLTVIRQTQKSHLREAYANKVWQHLRLLLLFTYDSPPPQKYLPLDLRPKKTRAIRRRLTDEQKGKKTERATKKANYYPLRRFAVRA
jgi:large subunit ribosomal protein L35e